MKVSRFIVLFALVAVMSVVGCKKEEPVATAPAPQVGAPVADPQVKQFLSSLEKAPPAERARLAQTNRAMATQIMSGNDLQAKVELQKLMGH